MRRKIYPTILILAIIPVLLSCSKEEVVNVPDASPVMTLHFTGKFVPDQFPVIVFLSTPDGKNIVDTTCSANDTYILYAPNDMSVPERIIVTIVHPATFWHNLKVSITTYSSVVKGSEWTLTGTTPDKIGEATVSLENVPTLTGPILYSTSGSSNITFNPTGRTTTLYQSPDDLYIKIQNFGNQFYKIIPGITSNGVYTADMSDAAEPYYHRLVFPMPSENYEVQLYGYKDANFDSPLPVLVDNPISNGLPVAEIDLAYPPSVFTGFHTKMMIQETWSSDETFFNNTEGNIPDGFEKINASVTSMQPATGNVTIGANGTFNMVGAHWEFIDYALMFYEWQVYSPDTTKKIILPQVPAAFTRMFPTIRLDSLTFQYAELTDFQSLSSYDELIGKMFDPAHPTQMDRYNSTSVRKSVVVK